MQEGHPPLYIALAEGHGKVVEVLLKKGADDSYTDRVSEGKAPGLMQYYIRFIAVEPPPCTPLKTEIIACMYTQPVNNVYIH